MKLRFWGVRGSVPTPHADRLRYGGNTTCLEFSTPSSEEIVLIDAGSGLRALGEDLEQRPTVRRIHILISHFHWDHIQGLPHFPPLFQPSAEIVFYSSYPAAQTCALLQAQMSDPYFPMAFEAVPAQTRFRQIARGKPFAAGPFTVEAFALHHPQGAEGFRLEAEGRVIVHASDHEYGQPETDAVLVDLAREADLLIMDAQYTPREYAAKVGWGHSTYAQAAQLARQAAVRRLALFHHDPAHNDAFLDAMLADAKQLFPTSDMAREGCDLAV